MHITYDIKYDTLYIRLVDEHEQVLTKRMNEDVALDLGKDDRLVGIEILNARDVLNHGVPLTLDVENLPVTSRFDPPGPRETGTNT